MCVALTIACLAMLTLTQRVLIVQDGLAVTDLQRKIESEKVSNQRLEMALFAQESPGRIRRQAETKLRMVEPEKVSYMQIPLSRPALLSKAPASAPRRTPKSSVKPQRPGVLDAVLEKVTRQLQLLPLGNVGIFADQ